MNPRIVSRTRLTDISKFRVIPLRSLCLVPLFLLLLGFSSTNAAQLPQGFSQIQVAAGLTSPTTMAFAPDGRLFVCEQAGRVLVIKNGVLLATPFLTLDVDSSGERGLLGIAFDPNFATNHYLYVYYTVNSEPRHNRVSRFTANGDVGIPGSETLIFRLPDLIAATHNSGALNFGPDGKLYISVGDNVRGPLAQSLDNLLGKILRINTDGTIPADNPFYGSTTGDNRAIWALGLRNPFSFAIHSTTGKMYINDVGQLLWEELNEGIRGANYGWPTCEGSCANPGFQNPVYEYPHAGSGCDSIAGGAFYNPLTNQFPQQYAGKYFFSDWCHSWIKVLDPATNTVTDFGVGEAWGLVDLEVGPDGSLYYVLWSFGLVFKIQYTANLVPVISTHPSSRTVSEGHPTTFSVSATGQEPITYRWQKNGVDIAGATSTSYILTATSMSDNGASFRAVVTNQFGSVTSNEATLTVTLNQPPTGNIISPGVGTIYRAGDTITYSGSATDIEDGSLQATAFNWRVDFHHEAHFHPFVPPTTGATTGAFIIPTSGETSSEVWYRIHLTITDSLGLTHSSFRDVLPQKSTITMNTSPAGMQLTLDGQPHNAPFTFVGVVGLTRTLGVVTPQVVDGVLHDFATWSDDGAANHSISTPSANTTYTATFTPRPSVQLSNASFSAAENGNGIQVTATRTLNSQGAVSVTYATGGGTATAGTDYTATSGTVNFANGEISKTIFVPVIDDAVFEGNETLNLTLSNPNGAILSTPASAVLTITENELPPELSIADVLVNEGNAGPVAATFNVSLSVASSSEVSVTFETDEGTALAGADYLNADGVLTFAPGQTGKTVMVTILGDIAPELQETFTMRLSGAMNAGILRPLATATIVDNRSPLFVTEENSGRAVILESVLFTPDPFSLFSPFNLSTDGRTRLSLFIANARLQPEDDASVVTARLEDLQQNVYPVTVEHVGAVPGFDWLTQIVVRLPDRIGSAGEFRVSVSIRGLESDKPIITLRP